MPRAAKQIAKLLVDLVAGDERKRIGEPAFDELADAADVMNAINVAIGRIIAKDDAVERVRALSTKKRGPSLRAAESRASRASLGPSVPPRQRAPAHE